MALSPAARVVAVGVPPDGGDADVAAVSTVLRDAGLPVTSRVFVDDDEAALEQALAPGPAVTVVLVGHGGVAGDAVRRVVARAAGARLVLSERMLGALTEHHRRRDRPLPRRAERLALLPQGAAVWVGDDVEPGWALESPGGAVAVLARGGLGAVATAALAALARERLAGRPQIAVRTLKTAGVALADVEERLLDWLGKEGPVTVTTLPAGGEVWVRLTARAATSAEVTEALAAVQPRIADALGADLYGEGDDSLELVVGRRLRERRLMVSVAESCTGGLLGHRLTSVPGSSAYFERGVIVYSNRAKQELLGVSEDVLRAHGAVSGPCAEAMVTGLCERTGSECGISVTGVAGPDGGSVAKPVGTVFIGLAIAGEVSSRRYRFDGDRAAVKWQSAEMALDLLRRGLGGTPRTG
jgi:nicotinamide-nucleotide amidase